MKKLSLLILLSILPFFAFGQNTAIKVADNGNVGVNTDNPTSKLEVNGLTKTKGNTIRETQASASIVCERTDRAAMIMGAGWHNGFSIDQEYDFSIFANSRSQILNRVLTGGSLMMTGIGSTGYFGFGVYNPTERIHVVGNIFATGTITPSDRRLKENVTSFTDGLNVIKKLNTIRYQYNGKAGLETGEDHIGVYAQELQEAAPYLVEEFVHQDKDDQGKVILEETYLKIRDSEIKYLLLNAVKEQQAIIEDLQKELQAVKEMIRKDETGKIESSQEVLLEGKGRLMQNIPNPFDKNTIIQYEVKDVNAQAEIQIFSLTGRLVKVVALDNQAGQVNLQVQDITAGTYTYSLVINNEIVDTKKMILKQ